MKGSQSQTFSAGIAHNFTLSHKRCANNEVNSHKHSFAITMWVNILKSFSQAVCFLCLIYCIMKMIKYTSFFCMPVLPSLWFSCKIGLLLYSVWWSQRDEGCHCRWSKEDERCGPKCPLHPLLRTSTQSDHATGHFSHTQSENYYFFDLGGFASFFSRSPKRTDVLDKVVAHRLPTSSRVR